MMIMGLVCSKPKDKLSDASIRKIHNCQSYIQIHCLSDMCTADGTYILETVLQDERVMTQSASRNDEIVQNKIDAIA